MESQQEEPWNSPGKLALPLPKRSDRSAKVEASNAVANELVEKLYWDEASPVKETLLKHGCHK
jgi:hypothetical protein